MARRVLSILAALRTTITPPSAAGSTVGTTVVAQQVTISDPNDVFTQALRIDLPADPSGFTRTNANGAKGTGAGAPDTWGTYYGGNPTGYGNEFGEIRAGAAKSTTIAFRAKAATGTADGRKTVDTTDASGNPQAGMHLGGIVTVLQRSTAAPTDSSSLPTNHTQMYARNDGMLYIQDAVSGRGEQQQATTVERVNTQTPSANYTIPDVTTATMHAITLTANRTLTLPTPAAGKSLSVYLIQDATGSRTVTWATPSGAIKWPSATAPTLTTTASKADEIVFRCYDGTNWIGSLAASNL